MAHVDNTVPRKPVASLVSSESEQDAGWVFLDDWLQWAKKNGDMIVRQPTPAELQRAPLYAMMAMRRETVVPFLARVLYRQGYGRVPDGVLVYVCDYSSWWCANGAMRVSKEKHMPIPMDRFDYPKACVECNALFCLHWSDTVRQCSVCVRNVCDACTLRERDGVKHGFARCARCNRSTVMCRQHEASRLRCACRDSQAYHLCRTCFEIVHEEGVCRTCRHSLCGCEGAAPACRLPQLMRSGHCETMGPYLRLTWQSCYALTHPKQP